MVTMKHFLFICALISAAALIDGSSIESDGFDLLGGGLLSNKDLRITEEQKKCLEDGKQKVKDEYPNLKEWFDDIERTSKRLTKLADTCYELNGIGQKLCLKLLTRIAQAEGRRLFGKPTEEQKVVLAKIQEIVNECLEDETPPGETKVAFDVFANDLLQTDGVRATDEQKICIQDGYLKVKANNPSLQSWFNDIEQTSNKLAEDAEKCEELTGLPKVKCFVKLYANARQEFSRIFGDLSEEQKQALEQLRNVVLGCLQGSVEAKKEESYKSVINSEDFIEMLFNFFANSTAITEEQIDCIKEGYKKVITENPELQAWFDEVEAVSKLLTQAAQECEAQSGLNQLKCYVKLIKTARDEIIRLANELSVAQKEILKALADVVKECLSSKPA